MKGIIKWIGGPSAKEMAADANRVVEPQEPDSILNIESISFSPSGGTPAIMDFYEFVTSFLWFHHKIIPSLFLEGDELESEWKIDVKDVAKKYYNLHNSILKAIDELKSTQSLIGNKKFKKIRQDLENALKENDYRWVKQLL